MKWLLLIPLAFLLFDTPALGIAAIVLYFVVQWLQKPQDAAPATQQFRQEGQEQLTPEDLENLVLLRLELQNLEESGRIDTGQLKKLAKPVMRCAGNI